MKKILTVVGARPQFIKVAPVSRVLRSHFKEVIVNTGQHYDHNMSAVFFDELNIPKPDYDLGVGSKSHGQQTGEMLEKIEKVIFEESPDAILVYGDTNSTLAAAIAGAKLHIPIFHVEAGLRSFNKKMPEEVNRILTDHVSSLLFAPTDTAVENLRYEGLIGKVFNTGDVMLDAVKYNIKIAEKNLNLKKYELEKGKYFLATIHRAENTDDPLKLSSIFNALESLQNEIVVLPLHPRTKHKLEDMNMLDKIMNYKAIQVIEPLSYLEMLLLEKNAKGIITDSGGVQKEAYFSKIPCYTLRDQTEWVETVEAGWNTLVNPLEENLSDILKLPKPELYNDELYGNGEAAEKITEIIMAYLSGENHG